MPDKSARQNACQKMHANMPHKNHILVGRRPCACRGRAPVLRDAADVLGRGLAAQRRRWRACSGSRSARENSLFCASTF